MKESFIKLRNLEDGMFFRKKLDKKEYENLLRGLYRRVHYIFIPKYNIIMNEYNEKEFYFVKEEAI